MQNLRGAWRTTLPTSTNRIQLRINSCTHVYDIGKRVIALNFTISHLMSKEICNGVQAKINVPPLTQIPCQPLLLEFIYHGPTIYIWQINSTYLLKKASFCIKDVNAILASISKSSEFDPNICHFPATVYYIRPKKKAMGLFLHMQYAKRRPKRANKENQILWKKTAVHTTLISRAIRMKSCFGRTGRISGNSFFFRRSVAGNVSCPCQYRICWKGSSEPLAFNKGQIL